MKAFIFNKYIIGFLFMLILSMNQVKGELVSISLSPSNTEENGPIPNTIGILTTYDDGGTPLFGTYSLTDYGSYPDNSYFYIDGVNLVTNTTFNYETKASYTVRIRSVIGFEWVDATCIVSIDDINDSPVITSGGGGLNATVSIPENTTLVTTVTATDEDLPAQTLTYSITGGNDASKFSIIGTTGELSFVTAPDYENPTDVGANNVYNVQVRVIDNGSLPLTDYQNIAITVTDVNDRPDLGNVELETLQYTEDNTGTRITATTTVTDADDTQLSSARVYFSQGYVNGEDSLYLKSTLFTSSFNESTGVLNISGNRTLAQYRDSCLRKVMYTNTNHDNPDNSPDKIASFFVFDGDDYSDTLSRQIHINLVNDPPVASDATITSAHTPFRTREVLTAHHTYTDPENNPESGTTIAWLTSSSSSGTSPTTVRDYALQDTFTTRFTDGRRYIAAVILPRDNQGLTGDDDTSAWYYINDEPAMQNLTVVNRLNPGAIAVGQTVSADYTYYDFEGNPSGAHTFQWYHSTSSNSWSSATPISGETDSTYLIRSSDKNDWIGIEAYPYATIGSSPGQRTRSATLFQVGSLPTATISGSDSICSNGQTATLTVDLTGDNPPWTIKYTRNGANETTVSGIDVTPYMLEVTLTGTYALTEVSDTRYANGTVSGTGLIVQYAHPTATLTQSEVAICPGDAGVHTYPIALTGKHPWSVSIQKQGRIDSVTIHSIPTSPYLREVTLADSGVYHILHVWDAHCMAEGSGSTEIIKRTSPVGIMSGDTSVCPGEPAILPVELSGDGPWTIYYTHNGGSETSVYVNQNLTEYTYPLSVSQIGTYVLTRVVDQADEGCASGGAVVDNYTAPTAIFTEGTEICEQLNNKLKVTFTGTSPWTVSYRYEAGSPITVSDILTSPYDIPVANTGTYTLLTVEDENCSGTASGTLEIVPAPDVAISGLRTSTYMSNSISDTIFVNPTGGSFEESDFSGAIQYGGGYYIFWPVIAYSMYGTPFNIRYSYQNPVTTCVGKDSAMVFILSQPADIQVNGYRDMYCSNDDTITVYGKNVAFEDGTFTISAPGTGMVIDGNDPNIAYLLPWVIQSGSRTVTYSVVIDDVLKTAQKVFNFNHIVPNFTWDNECFNGESLVNFTDESTSTPNAVSGYKWNIYLDDDTVTSSNSTASYTFDNQDIYPVELVVSSQNITINDTTYCLDTIRKDLILKPTFSVNGLPYQENFDDGESLWFSYKQEGNTNSWKCGQPEGEIFNAASDEKAWYTDIADPNISEKSYVISPCFNFTKASRPMIKMDIWRGFTFTEPNIDGAVLQYTTDNGAHWSNVGNTVNDGIYWFNSYNITGLPGNQNIGWAATQDENWVEARHKLDELKDQTKVRFRIAYGALSGYGSKERDGIAFDNIWIGERSKKVLVEHFTNTGDDDCKTVNEGLNSLINLDQNFSDIIDLQFHTEFPGQDTFHIMNPGPPLSREWYYGISSVPYSIIDGGRNNKQGYIIDYSDADEGLTQEVLTLAVLDENKFKFNMQTIKGTGTIDIDIELVSYVELPETDLTLHTVIIENYITGVMGDNGETSFESVVKKMLPDEIGTNITRSWSAGATEEVSLHYDYEDVFDEKELRVVVFVQNNETQEVYQADIIDPNKISAIDPVEEKIIGFRLFPNPSRESAYVLFNEEVQVKTHIDIFNFNGSLVYGRDINPGQKLVELPISSYKPGIYMIKVSDNKSLPGTKKLIVSGNND